MRLISISFLFAFAAVTPTFALSAVQSRPPATLSAAQSPMAPAIGNVLVVAYPDAGNIEIKFWLAADGNFTMETPDGEFATGTWTDDAGRFCTTMSGGGTRCEKIGDRLPALGESSTMIDSQGQRAVVTIRAEPKGS